MRSRVFTGLALVSLLLAACGGATKRQTRPDVPTRSDVIKAANAICRQADAQAQSFTTGRPTPVNTPQVLLALETDRDIAAAAVKKLERLHPPTAQRAEFERFVGGVRGIEAGDVQFLSGLTELNKAVVTQGSAAAVSAGNKATQGANAYGLHNCPYQTIAQKFRQQQQTAQQQDLALAQKIAAAQDPIGSWTGNVTQYGPGRKRYHYSAKMTVRDVNTVGARAGSIRYPRFPCAGYLQLTARHANRFVFLEHITLHPRTCPSGGRITSTVNSGSMHWRWVRQGIVVLGTLTRH